ncbi:MAG: cell filamentation protein Fic [Planctomycetes bacterium SM23_25]|nr:MAG: cell filamentation protein Fic [Planctomycetes bacterium SM23_25]
MRKTGTYVQRSVAGEPYRAFVPHALPPDPRLSLTNADYDLMEKANRAVGRLDGISALLPDPSLFIYFYVRKEAVLSSQIEGTQSSLSDLLLYESEETPGVPLRDVREVSNYVKAVNYALHRIHADGLPVSLRLIREAHSLLLAGVRGGQKSPGEFRRSQNWLGGDRPGNAVYVPPPHESVVECMSALEKFLHDDPVRTPVLIKAGLAHAQFESIHPFLDGNGRIGRLLITILLCAEGVLREPLLYLSLYLKRHRARYYDLLQSVRESGDWEAWLRFFLTGVHETAQQAVETSRQILALFQSDRRRIDKLGRRSGSALRVHQFLQEQPVLSIPRAVARLGLTRPTVASAVQAMEKMGMLKEMTGKQRDRLFAYAQYLQILNEGTEP